MLERNIIYRLIVIGIIVFVSNADAFDDEDTHPHISEKSITASYLNDYAVSKLGMAKGIDELVTEINVYSSLVDSGSQIDAKKTKSISKWLTDGSIEEDSPMCRAANHFHNPLKLKWNEAQMSDDTYGKGNRDRSFFLISHPSEIFGLTTTPRYGILIVPFVQNSLIRGIRS